MADGEQVVAVARPGMDDWRLHGLDVEVLDLDLRDADAVDVAVRRVRPQRVFHLAAHGAYSWQRDVHEMIAVNVAGTVALLDALAATGEGVLVHAGSSSEYGLKSTPPREDDLIEPNSAYAATKAAATHFCALSPAPTATLRLYSAYGTWEDDRRLMPQLVAHALRGALPPLVSPDIARDFVYVDDVCDAFVRAAERLEGGADLGVLNVGSGRQVSLAELVELARDIWDIDEEPRWGSMVERDWDTTNWCSDPRKVAIELGWSARTTLRSGLQRMAAWMRERDAA